MIYNNHIHHPISVVKEKLIGRSEMLYFTYFEILKLYFGNTFFETAVTVLQCTDV